ncbi:uncharacterized protein CDAR_491331 [Caerostris darwini]|uniref:Uncharacterized protein n=1 Tax=Caerostris darwini TaxID=1538125 RepID=A0AAV4X6S3_9ARAC|nr:uncharacterized protein CDAR_491331 [Caerostris darwini]
MSNKQTGYLTDTCHLPIPCQCKSRCSAKSHSSSCLSSQYENQYFEGGDKGPLWFTRDDEFPRLLATPPSSSREPDASGAVPKKKKKRRKKSYAIDVVTGAGRTRRNSGKKKCRRAGGCKRQRLHSEDSSNKRSSGLGRDFEHSKRARVAIAVVALSLILLSFFLVGLTLRMAPIIDELAGEMRSSGATYKLQIIP